jgi:hypothetical protein
LLIGLVRNSLDFVMRDAMRLCASVCDTGLNLAVNWLSSVELAEKLPSINSFVNTAWMDRRQLYKINCGAQTASSAITSLFLYFQYQATLLELKRLKNQQDGYSAEGGTSVSRYKNI